MSSNLHIGTDETQACKQNFYNDKGGSKPETYSDPYEMFNLLNVSKK